MVFKKSYICISMSVCKFYTDTIAKNNQIKFKSTIPKYAIVHNAYNIIDLHRNKKR